MYKSSSQKCITVIYAGIIKGVAQIMNLGPAGQEVALFQYDDQDIPNHVKWLLIYNTVHLYFLLNNYINSTSWFSKDIWSKEPQVAEEAHEDPNMYPLR